MSEFYDSRRYCILTTCRCRFFKSKGAVAGVFVVVGLAIAAIAAWIFIALRRRRRTRKIESDTAISASLAAAGFKRPALEDEDEDGFDVRSPSASTHLGGMTQRSGSGLGTNYDGDFNPYVGFGPGRNTMERDGYAPARTSSPPLLPPLPFGISTNHSPSPSDDDAAETLRDGGNRHSGNGHVSSSSYEPLLANFAAAGVGGSSDVTPPTPPARNPQRLTDMLSASPQTSPVLGGFLSKKDEPDRASSEYSSESADHDDRLDPGLKRRVRAEDDERSHVASTTDLRDDEDYSRPVLVVRNMTNMSEITDSSEAGVS